MSTDAEPPIVSLFGMNSSPWIAIAFYGGLAALQFGTGVAYAADGPITEATKETVRIDVIAITAVASSAVTLVLGLAHLYSAFLFRRDRDKSERDEKRYKETMEIRWKAVEARLALLKAGIHCDLPQCPVVATVKGEVEFDKIPFGKPPKPARHDEDTVDIP
jgi:hypothetical protein